MDLGTVLIILALGIFTAIFIAQPLMGNRGLVAVEGERQLSELLAERDRVLTTLQDLDMDFAIGKVLEEDYRAQRDTMVTRGAEVLRAIDELSDVDGEAMPDTDLEVEIETAVAQLRRGEGPASGLYCSSCGNEVIAGDRFCVHCGASLDEEGT
jgi:hypothetical protein